MLDLDEDEIGEVESQQQDLDVEVDERIESNDSIAESNGQSTYSHENYPILCNTFKDPFTQLDKVILAVCLPGGAKNIRIDIDDDGMSATVKYKWPKTSYVMSDLFESKLSPRGMQIYHPMIVALNNMLEKARARIDTAPESVITVKLPIKVQSTLDPTDHWGITRKAGAKIVVVVFTGYVKQYSKKIADYNVKFES